MKLLYYPDPRLRTTSKEIGEVDEQLRESIPEMFKIMYRARGVGLAGPQVGMHRRIIVANLTGDPEETAEERVFINPEIVDKAGEVREEEGCLSLPGMAPVILRAEQVTVKYRDLEGNVVERPTEGLEAKLFQHEIDHLDGILILDKMSPADQKKWAPLLQELEEDFEGKADSA